MKLNLKLETNIQMPAQPRGRGMSEEGLRVMDFIANMPVGGSVAFDNEKEADAFWRWYKQLAAAQAKRGEPEVKLESKSIAGKRRFWRVA